MLKSRPCVFILLFSVVAFFCCFSQVQGDKLILTSTAVKIDNVMAGHFEWGERGGRKTEKARERERGKERKHKVRLFDGQVALVVDFM